MYAIGAGGWVLYWPRPDGNSSRRLRGTMKLPCVRTIEAKRSTFVKCFEFALAVFACVLASAPSVFAQGATAQINGAIRDASGAVIPGATVTTTNADTRTQR